MFKGSEKQKAINEAGFTLSYSKYCIQNGKTLPHGAPSSCSVESMNTGCPEFREHIQRRKEHLSLSCAKWCPGLCLPRFALPGNINQDFPSCGPAYAIGVEILNMWLPEGRSGREGDEGPGSSDLTQNANALP